MIRVVQDVCSLNAISLHNMVVTLFKQVCVCGGGGGGGQLEELDSPTLHNAQHFVPCTYYVQHLVYEHNIM